MVNRLYFCKDCGYEYETVQPMHEDLHTVCPKCNGKLAQDLTGVFTSIKQYNTVGSLAERNASALGHYGRELKEKQLKEESANAFNAKKERLKAHGIKPFEVDHDKAIQIGQAPPKVIEKMTNGDLKGVEKYVFTGES